MNRLILTGTFRSLLVSLLRRKRTRARRLVVVLFGTLSLCGGSSMVMGAAVDFPSEVTEEVYELGRQNLLLRSYFGRQARDHYLNPNPILVNPSPFLRSEREIRFRIDRYTNQLIDHFMSRLVETLNRLRTSRARAERHRTAWQNASGSSKGILAKEFKRALKEVESLTDDLRDTLAFPLGTLESKTTSEPRVSLEEYQRAYEVKWNLIQEEIELAEQSIQTLFFSPTHTVRVEQLSSANLLMRLHHAEKLAKALREFDSTAAERR